ncbi:MaoC family dehydratase N-terminal domain-containing protein [Polaromonas sp. P1-6]|nr:MaoC family dehydratase N-terminal domain-containing protein [Polaromonas sp. P1-6]
MDEATVKGQLLAPSIGEDSLAQATALLGTPIRVEQWNHEASWDAIRHYAWGLGDDNPLYCDPAYAKDTRWGGLVAPPTFFYGIWDAVVAPGLPDVQWFYSGIDAEFHEPIRRNDTIVAHAEYVDAKALKGKTVSNMLVQTGDVRYVNQDGTLVTRVLSHTFRVARTSAEGGLKYAPRDKHVYTADELEKIVNAQVNEYRRGAEVLYWDDVEAGTALPGTVRGPINQQDMTAYYCGAVGTSGYKSTKLRWKYRHWAHHSPERLPNNYDRSYFGAAVLPSIGHQDAKVATQDLGMPGPYDNGPQRIGMLSTCATNWMGDSGFLRKLSARLKLPVIFGDCTFTKGRVTGKRLEGEQGLVDLELWGENQLGQITVQGSAVVELPRR